jgi:hypothetical protein
MDAMKDYCSRARAALNLILLLSLIQVWGIFSEANSAESIDADINTVYIELTPYLPSFGDVPPNGLMQALATTLIKDENDLPLSLFNDQSTNRFLYKLLRSKGSDNSESPIVERKEMAPYDAFIRIQKMISRAGLSSKATILELKHHYSGDIEVPILKQSIEPEDATVVMEVATVFPLALLFVLFDTMRRVLKKMKDDGEDIDPLDCIFFYRSWSAIPVSIIWLILPLALFASRFQQLWTHLENTQTWVAFLFACLSPVLALACLLQGFMARRVYLSPYPG